MLEQESKSFGGTYKYIRRAKNFSQEKVTGDYISRSSLSKFEHDKQTIYLNNFLKLLQELELSVAEFLFINNDYKLDVADHLRDCFYRTHFTGDVPYFKKLSRRIGEFLEVEEDWGLRLMKGYLDVMVNRSADTTGEQMRQLEALAQEAWEEIGNYDEWFVNDLRLLNVFMYYLPREIVSWVIERMEKRIGDYREAFVMKNAIPGFCLNASSVYIKHGMLDEAAELAEQALRAVHRHRRYDYHVVGLVRKGTALKDFDLINEAFQIADVMGDAELAQQMSVEVIMHLPKYYSEYPADLANLSIRRNHMGKGQAVGAPAYHLNGHYWFPI